MQGKRTPKKANKYFHDFWHFVQPYKKPLRTVYGLYFSNALLNLIPALSVRYYIDVILLGKDARFFGMKIPGCADLTVSHKIWISLLFLIASVAVICGANTIGVLMWRCGTVAVESVIFDVKQKIHQHINHLSMGYFDSERVGELMTKAVSDVQAMSMMLQQSFSLLYAIVMVSIGLLVMFVQSWSLTFIVLIPIPLILYAFYSVKRRLRPMYRKQRDTQSRIQTHMQETVSGIREIKAFNMEDSTYDTYSDINQDYYSMQNRIMRVYSFNHQLQYGSKDLGVVLLAVCGGIMVFGDVGGVTVGKIASFMVLSGYVYGPLSQFLNFYNIVQRGMASLERIIDFLNESPQVKDASNVYTPAAGELLGNVRFEKVTFGYDSRAPVIHDVSFAVEAGTHAAIVGGTGSGKSTLMALLLRFYDVDEGRIYVDGRDIKSFNQLALRRNIGVVFQDPFLFYGTIRDNLLFVNPNRSEADMIEACRAANIFDAIMELPHQFDTIVGERGTRLSGGQKQRLAIARVLLKDPRIVILDEATSAVDTITEKRVQEGIERMCRGRTALIIAHRLSTVQKCDKIIVLHQGRIQEQGRHEELIEADGVYASMCRYDTL